MAEWLFLIIILIFSAVIHEVAHGAVAYSFGRPDRKICGPLDFKSHKTSGSFRLFILPVL